MRLLSWFALLVTACGGSAAVDANAGCDWVGNEYGFNQVHSCTEVPSGISQTIISKLQTNCSNGGGTWVPQCSHSASGSCQFVPSDPAVLMTEWYLSSSAQDAMTFKTQ